ETLSGDSSGFAGQTHIDGGSLWVNGVLGGASGATSVANGAQLGGIGTVGGSVTVADGGIVTPGATGQQVGTLAITGDFALGAGSILNVDAGQVARVGNYLNDLITVGGNLTLGGTLNVAEAPGGRLIPGIYRIIDYNGNLTDLGLAIGTTPVAGLSVQ